MDNLLDKARRSMSYIPFDERSDIDFSDIIYLMSDFKEPGQVMNSKISSGDVFKLSSCSCHSEEINSMLFFTRDNLYLFNRRDMMLKHLLKCGVYTSIDIKQNTKIADVIREKNILHLSCLEVHNPISSFDNKYYDELHQFIINKQRNISKEIKKWIY